MSLTGILAATILAALLLVMATLSTSVIYAATQILSRTADMLFDLNRPSRSRASFH